MNPCLSMSGMVAHIVEENTPDLGRWTCLAHVKNGKLESGLRCSGKRGMTKIDIDTSMTLLMSTLPR